ncbi:MAG: RnfABCDGE type electron transport complex subunit D [Candidatus Omnitrophota bacterium]
MNLTVAVSPHIKSGQDIRQVMRDVIIALTPAALTAIWFYRYKGLFLLITCVASCCLAEYLFAKATKRKETVSDLSAIVTGLLLAFCLPPAIPLWIAAAGGLFAILVGKAIFGGLGHNPFNPALVGRAFLQVSWPKDMSLWIQPYDALTTATPLGITKLNLPGILPDTWMLFFGNFAGSLGETPKLMLLLGALYLLYRRHIKLYTPLSYIITAAALALLFRESPVFHLLTGGLILGAFFMATDPVTTPLSRNGKIIFGIGCGVLTMLIRLKGGFPEGVCYSILIMNMLTPFIDKMTVIKKFGAT